MKILFLILGIITFTSCNSEDDTTAFEPIEIEFTEIGKGSLYRYNEEVSIDQTNMVISSSIDWQNFLNQIDSYNSNVVNTFTETNIDFDSFTIIIVILDVKPVNWSVDITTIIENEDNIVVSQEDTEGGYFVIQQPYHIVKIPITDKPIVFE